VKRRSKIYKVITIVILLLIVVLCQVPFGITAEQVDNRSSRLTLHTLCDDVRCCPSQRVSITLVLRGEHLEKVISENISASESDSGTKPHQPKQIITTGSGVRLRVNPDTTSLVLQRLSIGTVLTVLQRSASTVRINGTKDYWYLVKDYSNTSGWVFGMQTFPFDNTHQGIMTSYREIIKRRSALPPKTLSEDLDFLLFIANILPNFKPDVKEITQILNQVEDRWNGLCPSNQNNSLQSFEPLLKTFKDLQPLENSDGYEEWKRIENLFKWCAYGIKLRAKPSESASVLGVLDLRTPVFIDFANQRKDAVNWVKINKIKINERHQNVVGWVDDPLVKRCAAIVNALRKKRPIAEFMSRQGVTYAITGSNRCSGSSSGSVHLSLPASIDTPFEIVEESDNQGWMEECSSMKRSTERRVVRIVEKLSFLFDGRTDFGEGQTNYWAFDQVSTSCSVFGGGSQTVTFTFQTEGGELFVKKILYDVQDQG
jgi:hypothetical protein